MLKFTRDTYFRLMAQIPDVPFEVGGIIGGETGIVKDFRIDHGGKTQRICCYVPDTELMNDWIEEWRRESVEFYGIFHTHFGGAEKMSSSDETYIETIMAAMPDWIQRLYFPIILVPEKKMILYVAERGQRIARSSFLLLD